MLRRRYLVIVTVSWLGVAWGAPAQTTSASAPVQTAPTSAPAEKELLSADTFAGLAFRSLGPALMSGRISDLVVNPQDRHQWYVAAASGGVWKTTNAGTTWTPIFDAQGSYSIGCLALDPKNPAVLWVGTGENNSQRSVGFGDGVYRTRDAGVTWENLGLKDSEHIGMIRIDPRDSDVVYVAAQGPLWRLDPSAACTRPPTAARPGCRSSRSARTPASTRCISTRAIPTCSTLRHTSAGGMCGR